MLLRPLWRWLGFEGLPSEEFKRRTTAIEMGVFMSSAGVMYSLIYMVLGFANLPIMALAYASSFVLNLLLLHFTGKFNVYEHIQLLSVLLFPLAGHIYIGGFENSSMVILAIFLAPAAALLFTSVAIARRYFYAAAAALIIAGIWDYLYAPAERLPPVVLGVCAVTCPLSIFAIMYFLMEGFRRKQEELRAELQQSLINLKATQNQLVQREKMASLGELTAGIAHEIQNPLNFVTNFSDVGTELCEEALDLLAPPTLQPADKAELTDLLHDLARNQTRIAEHGRRAAGIVRSMLEHSRASTGERRPTDLNALCDEYLQLAYHGLRAKDASFQAELQTDFAPTLPHIEAVGQDLGRVLLNLFTNAFYTVHQRRKQNVVSYQPIVRIRTRQIGNELEIRVRDNGMGMSEAVMEKIFQPFFTTKPTGEGTGLGLSLSYDIITKGHGGTLRAESQPGEGTEMVVILPL